MRTASHDVGHEVSLTIVTPVVQDLTLDRTHLATIGYPAPRTVSKLEDQVFLF